MAQFDCFAAALRCPFCRTISPEDGTTEMMTWIRAGDAAGELLRTGDDLDITAADLPYSRYFVSLVPAGNEALHVLEIWRCPTCRRHTFAEIIFRGGILDSIAPVLLSRAVLDRVHAIAPSIEDIFPMITGVVLNTTRPQADWLEQLRDALPADGSAWAPPGEEDPA
jgi:hypothetical protein